MQPQWIMGHVVHKQRCTMEANGLWTLIPRIPCTPGELKKDFCLALRGKFEGGPVEETEWCGTVEYRLAGGVSVPSFRD